MSPQNIEEYNGINEKQILWFLADLSIPVLIIVTRD
jgi:hypothetical protein